MKHHLPEHHSAPWSDLRHGRTGEKKTRLSSHNRRFIFLGFVLVFGGLVVLFSIAIGVVTYLVLSNGSSPETGYPGLERMVLILCLVPFGFIMLSGLLGGMAFRRFGGPMAEIMTATEAVAGGDLNVRLKEHGPPQIRSMARSFNRMIIELARAEQQRRNLTADVAHELRNPLHVIQGNLEGMLDGVYEPNYENLTATLEETRLMARLVTDLQTLSLAEAGQLPLHHTRFAADDLLSDVAASFSAQATELGVDLQIKADPAIELNGDYDRLDQVLSNLVANALRYTPAGGKVTLQAEEIDQVVRLVVSDTGKGIPEQDLPFIFDRFWKGNRARTRGESGSGLGLAIARQLVQAHGGQIEAASRSNEETVITIELPKAN